MAKKNNANLGYVDLTKTGPLSYRQLQMLNSRLPAESAINAMHPDNPGVSTMLSRVGKVNYTAQPTGLGESIYDPGIANQHQIENLQDVRAEAQPWYAKIGAGLAKGAILAGTTFLDGTVGLLIGSAEAATRKDWSGLWDNDFSRAMQAVNEWSEEVLPNYYSTEEQNSPWYENIFTANFIGDKFIKNLGFSVGALYSGGVTSAGLKLTKLPQLIGTITKSAKAPAMVSSAVGAITSAVNEGRIEALNNSKDWQNLKIQELDDNWAKRLDAKYAPQMESLAAEYQAAAQEYEATKGKLQKLGADGAVVDPAFQRYQAKLEALEQRRAALQNMRDSEWENRGNDKIYRGVIGKIEEDRLKMGNTDMLANLPILTFSNMVQFTKFYANGFNTARRAGVRTVSDAAEEAARYAGKTFSKGKAALKVTKGALSEGTEEISQKAASLVAGDYYSTDVNNFYKSQIDPNAEQETLDWVKSFANGINETVNDGSSWEEFFIGALTGLMGVPTFRSMRSEDGSFRSPVTLQGGAINEIREYRENIARSEEIANYLNQRVQSPEFLNYYRGMIRHNKYQNDMNRATEENDEFNFKNAEHAQFVSDIVMFDNAGKLEDLRAYIDSAYDMSDENLQAIVENTTATDENGKKIGPFVDSNGNPLYATEEGKQQMIEKLTQTRDNMISTLDNYRRTKNDLDIRTGGVLSDEQLSEMTWLKTQIDDWTKRASEMTPLVKRTLIDLSNNLETVLARNIGDASMESEEAIEAASKLANILGIGTNRIQQLRELAQMDERKLSAILTSSKNAKFVEGLIEDISTFGSDIINTLDKQNVVRLMQDLPKIGKGIETYNNKLEEYLADPSKIAESQDEAGESVRQDIQQRKSQDIRTNLSTTTSLEEFKNVLDQEEDKELNNSIIEELANEGNQVAKNYKETLQYDTELRLALSQLGETDQTTQDALSLWQEQVNLAENLEQIAYPNSVAINNEEAFMEDSGDDVELAGTRFENARYALQRAMSKVNNDIKFKNRFSEEYRKPVDEQVQGKGTDKDETGDSGTPTVPHVNPGAAPVEAPSAPVGNVTAEMVAAENSDANRRVETQRTLDQRQQGQRRYYRPAVPELHIEASKEGDFRPFDVVVAERETGVDFSGIYSYLRDNGAFNYVNAAKLKPGDTLGFMIDPEFNDHTIFLVDTRNNQIVGSIDESDASIARYEGLEGVINKVRDEFAKRGEEATGKFFATPQVRVSKMMVGRIPYTSEERSLADIPGVIDSDTKPILGIIKNGVLTTNEKIDDRLIIKPVDMAQKEGRLYLLIPNAAGTYSPAAVRVKHFNTQEFNLDDATVAATPIGRGINEALDKLADATSQDDVSIAMKELASDIYMQDVMVTWFDAEAGSGIVVSKKVRKPDGTYEMVTINGQEQIKEEKTTIYFQNSKRTATINGMEINIEAAKDLGADLSLFGQPRDTADIRKDILNTILRYNLPLQVSVSKINDSGYNNRVIKSNILTSNLREAKVIGSWFTTDYFDNQGNLQKAVSPSSVKPAPSRRVSSPVGGTEGVVQGTRVTVSGTPYIVDLKHSIAVNEKTGEKRAFSAFNSQSLIDLAWAQENFGDATESSVMAENKIITPKGDVLDRATGHYVTGEEAQRIKDKITGRSRANEARVAQSKRVIADIYENQKKVDKTKTDSQYYYILEGDGQYHQYSRVHSRLGDNWLGERAETENSKRALEAGTAVDKVIRDFFTSKETPVRPETLSESAFIDLITKLTEIKSKMEQLGETFMTNNIVLFQKYADGTRVAGEVDILSVDKNGNFKIYDVKTSRYSFSDRYFTEKSSKQRMSTKDYYTLQLSAYQNLFESQYGVRPTRLAILPFVLTYEKNRVASITGEKGILIDYNPAVNVPLASAVQAPQQQNTLPIFDPTMETMITNPKEQNRVLPENAFEEGGEIGYYEKDSKLYTGYLKKVGGIEVTYGSGQKDMVPIHLTKVRDRGFGREGEFGSTSEYLTVFPNGMAISTRTNDTNDDHAAKVIMEALSKNPSKVLTLSSEKTQIHNPRALEEMEVEIRNKQYSGQSGASRTVQKEGIINNHDEEFEDELVLYDDFFDNPNYGKNIVKVDGLEARIGTGYTTSKMEELFHRFATSEQQEELSYLADRVFRVTDKLGIKVIFSNDFGFGEKGSYSSNNTIKLNHKFFTDDFLNHTKAPIILHEMIHAVTMYILSDKTQDRVTGNLKEAADAIRAVYDSIKNDPSLVGEYGVSNAKEMIAEMANPRFRTKLKKLNVWQRIKEAIKKLFSLDKTSSAFDTLDAALDLALDSFDIDLYNDYVGAKTYGSYNPNDWAFYREATNREKAEVSSEVRNWAGRRVYQGNSPNIMIDDLGNGYILIWDGLYTYHYEAGRDVENIKFIYKNSDRNRGRIQKFIDNFYNNAYFESTNYEDNSSWKTIPIETRQALEAKGWTQEKFDSISQREREQAVECVGL